MREILDMVNEDVIANALGGVTKKKKTLLEEGRKQAAGAVGQVGGGLAQKALGKLAEAGVTAAATAVGGPAGAAAAQGAMKGAKALKTANKIAGAVGDAKKYIKKNPATLAQQATKVARTGALVNALVGTRKIKPENDEELKNVKERYKQVSERDPGLTDAEKRQIRGETAAQRGKGFETFGDPNRVGATTADLKRTVAMQQQQGLDAAKEIKDETDIRFVDNRERLARLKDEGTTRLNQLRSDEKERANKAEYKRDRAVREGLEREDEKGKSDERTILLQKEAERRAETAKAREREGEFGVSTPRFAQKKTGGMTRGEMLEKLGFGKDTPDYVLDMSEEELYERGRKHGIF
jgi:hypothetical protein